MIRRDRIYWGLIFQLADLFIIAGVYATYEWILSVQDLPFAAHHILSILILIIIWCVAARPFDLYRSKRMVGVVSDLKSLLICLCIFIVATQIGIYTKLITLSSISSFRLFSAIFVAMLGFHAFVRLILRYFRTKGYNQRRLLIFGTGASGKTVATQISENPWMGFSLVGFLENKPSEPFIKLRDGKTISVLGESSDVWEVCVSKNIHEIVVCLPSKRHNEIVKFVHMASHLHVNIHVVPDLHDVITVSMQVDNVGGIPMIGVKQPLIRGSQAIVKRSIDIIGAMIGIIIFSPLWWIIPLLIKLDSSGPVMFIQERIGENGKPFRMFKFRTMVADAESRLNEVVDLDSLDKPMFKVANDPRITRVGGILRKTSLDELPQFFNVLMGDMSLVGPRPEESKVVALYDYYQRQRLAVKPGLTGPMQVNGRGDLDFDGRLALDLDYIRNYSLTNDVELLLKTVPSVLLGKGAH